MPPAKPPIDVKSLNENPLIEEEISLSPGDRIGIEVLGAADGNEYSSRVASVTEAELYVLAPIYKRETLMVPLGTIVRMGMRIDGVYFSFDTDIVEHVFQPQPTLGVSLPEVMTRRDQRKYYRLPLVMQPDVITLVDDDGKSASRVHGTIVNVSGGGLGLVSPEPVRPGVLLAIQFGLEDQTYASVAQVVSVEEPEEGRFNHHAHLQFLNMSRHDREEIVRYVFRKQITQFRQGLHEEVAG